MSPDTRRSRQGRVTRIVDGERAAALIDGRTTVVTALRGGPLACGDRVHVVAVGSEGPVVEVRSRGARIPLLGDAPRMAPAA
jgi:hypothetical protein